MATTDPKELIQNPHERWRMRFSPDKAIHIWPTTLPTDLSRDLNNSQPAQAERLRKYLDHLMVTGVPAREMTAAEFNWFKVVERPFDQDGNVGRPLRNRLYQYLGNWFPHHITEVRPLPLALIAQALYDNHVWNTEIAIQWLKWTLDALFVGKADTIRQTYEQWIAERGVDDEVYTVWDTRLEITCRLGYLLPYAVHVRFWNDGTPFPVPRTLATKTELEQAGYHPDFAHPHPLQGPYFRQIWESDQGNDFPYVIDKDRRYAFAMTYPYINSLWKQVLKMVGDYRQEWDVATEPEERYKNQHRMPDF